MRRSIHTLHSPALLKTYSVRVHFNIHHALCDDNVGFFHTDTAFRATTKVSARNFASPSH